MERMMKLQDVLLKAMAKKITWWQAAEIVGVTDRTMRRWRERLEEQGYSGLADRRKGKRSHKRVPLATGKRCRRRKEARSGAVPYRSGLGLHPDRTRGQQRQHGR